MRSYQHCLFPRVTPRLSSVGGSAEPPSPKTWAEYGLTSNPPICIHCADGDAELRRCSSNRGVAWQCRNCLRMVGNWIRHARLAGLQIDTLPEWVRR